MSAPPDWNRPGRSRATAVVLSILLAAVAVAYQRPLMRWFTGKPTTLEGDASGTRMPPPGSATDVDHYTCSMHPTVKQAAPGRCPICGMDLVPVTREQHEQGVVTIDDVRRQRIGVRVGAVRKGPMRETFRAVGRVAYDESALVDVSLKVHGWITKLFVNETGQRVAKGQPLFTVYSPELYNAEQDYLLALHRGGTPAVAAAPLDTADPMAHAARQRLHLLGLDDAQIDGIARAGAPLENLAVPAPASGFVIEKDVVEGAAVDAGMRLYRLARLTTVWVEADIYEADLRQVHAGQAAKVTLDYLPGRSYDAKVAYVYPYLDPKGRTGRLRIELANAHLDLRPGMYASVELSGDEHDQVQVPAAAVVYTGPRRVVFVDLGEGRFEPREIQIGSEADGMFVVRSGLKEGDLVATSGVFLIAAEARIRTAATYWTPPVVGQGARSPATGMPAAMPSGGASP